MMNRLASVAILIPFVLFTPTFAQADGKDKVTRQDKDVYEGTTSTVVKLEEFDGRIAEYPTSIMDEKLVITIPGHVRRGKHRWGVTPIPGKHYDGTAGTGTQWTMLLNPKLERLRIMRSEFVDKYLTCLYHSRSGEPRDPDAVVFNQADRDLTKCVIQLSFENELGDPGLVAIAARMTKEELQKLFEVGTLRVVFAVAQAAKEIERQLTNPVVSQCTGPPPKSSAEFQRVVDGARWNSKRAECIVKHVGEKDRAFWTRWAEGRRRDVRAAEWRARHLTSSSSGPNPIQYDGFSGYTPGTCRACMP